MQPREVWLVDPSTGAPRPLRPDTGGPRTDDAGVAPQLVDLRARDGLTLTGWLFTPRTPGPHPDRDLAARRPRGAGTPRERAALPIARRPPGIAVFAANVRGSSGFGRSFVDADNIGLLGTARSKTSAAVCRPPAGQRGRRARPLGVMGRSYGGYLVLAVLVTFPGLFAVGVAAAASPTSPPSSRAPSRGSRRPPSASTATRPRDADLLRDLSPMTHIDRLHGPPLLIHGPTTATYRRSKRPRSPRPWPPAGCRTATCCSPGRATTSCRGPTPRRPVRPPPAG